MVGEGGDDRRLLLASLAAGLLGSPRFEEGLGKRPMVARASYYELKLLFTAPQAKAAKSAVRAMLAEAGLSFVDAIVDGVGTHPGERSAEDLFNEECDDLPMLVYDMDHQRLGVFSALVGRIFPDVGRVLKPLSDELWSKPWREGDGGFSTQTFDVVVAGNHYIHHDGRLRILMGKGKAFGDGRHVSTRVLLSLVERRLSTCARSSAFDLGTGNGIIAIVLAKLGVPQIVATDLDPVILAEASGNAARNKVTGRIVFENRTEVPPGLAEFIAANILTPELLRLLPSAVAGLATNGELCLAGFNTEEESLVCDHARAAGLTLCDRQEELCWLALAFQKLS